MKHTITQYYKEWTTVISYKSMDDGMIISEDKWMDLPYDERLRYYQVNNFEKVTKAREVRI